MWGGDGWWLMLRSDGCRPVAHDVISRIVTSVDLFTLAVVLNVNLILIIAPKVIRRTRPLAKVLVLVLALIRA